MFINTENNNQKSNFFNAIINSLPSYDGLWFPENIQPLHEDFIHNLNQFSFQQIALEISCHLLHENKKTLQPIIEKSFDFPIKLKKMNNNLYFLETFHGPTLTFKDFGARFMSNYLQTKFIDNNEMYHILVSTSGDTGSAIASAFHNQKNFTVTILYPLNGISPVQELQMTTYNNNVTSFGIKGSFDDCQTIVKKCFVDNELNRNIHILSANSINLARLLPQCLYYFYCYSLLKKNYNICNQKINFIVPSGNCGNLLGAIIAKELGLPINTLISAQNDNDTFVRFLNENEFKPKNTIKTISNAMDVGDPSNFKRIYFFYKNKNKNFHDDLYGIKVNKKNTLLAMKEIYTKYNYIIDPHTSVGYYAYKYFKNKYKNNTTNHHKLSSKSSSENIDNINVIVSTAHPCKFKQIVETNLHQHIASHPNILKLYSQPKIKITINNNFIFFKKLLLNKKKKTYLPSISILGLNTLFNHTISEYISQNLNYTFIHHFNQFYKQKQNKQFFNHITCLSNNKPMAIFNENLSLISKIFDINIYLFKDPIPIDTKQYHYQFKKLSNVQINIFNHEPEDIAKIIINHLFLK